MSRIKTVTSALTAAFLVSGIGFAVAQSEDQQPAEPMTATALPSEETPADLNAMPVDATAQQQPAEQAPAADQPLPAQPADTTTPPAADTSIPAATTTAEPSYSEPAPRADRN